MVRLFSTLSSSSFSPKASSHTPFPRGATARLPHTAKWVNCDHSAWPLANLDRSLPFYEDSFAVDFDFPL